MASPRGGRKRAPSTDSEAPRRGDRGSELDGRLSPRQSRAVAASSVSDLPPVLFEDEHLLAFDKPSGLLSAPDRWDKEATHLVALAQVRYGPEAFNVHRLDRETTGVILFAKAREPLTRAARLFAEGKVRKRYLALVRGRLPRDEMTVDRPIASDPSRPGRMRLSLRYGRPAATELRALEKWRSGSLIEAFPKTGRTHQVRLHLASVGCPLLADPLYADGQPLLLSKLKSGYKFKKDAEERPLLARAALHAESLELPHPVTGEPLTIRAPLPKDFEIALKYLRRFG
ncbi:MAG: RluA family pseudouridine synthase [Verrucomicrobiae bacterium]|nr:RluA family pseudouridine synthase [Verrucomicrobiae bacterium]